MIVFTAVHLAPTLQAGLNGMCQANTVQERDRLYEEAVSRDGWCVGQVELVRGRDERVGQEEIDMDACTVIDLWPRRRLSCLYRRRLSHLYQIKHQ